jgi:GAF domain-containing protein
MRLKPTAVQFFDALERVDAAVARMLDQDAALAALLDSIRQIHSGFAFAAVQLIDPVAGMIETVQARGIARQWTGVARHPLEASQRDIQSDIAQNLTVEEISGWDERFDPWIYSQFDHDRLIRVFAPLFLVRQPGSAPNPPNDDFYAWDEDMVASGTENRRRIRPQSPGAARDTSIVRLGTVEAGHHHADLPAFPLRALRDLVASVRRHTPDIYRTQLDHVLDVIVESAMDLVGAQGGCLHFIEDEQRGRYLYQVAAGRVTPDFVERQSPRHGRLFQDVMDAGEPRWIDRGVRALGVANAQTRALACFPITTNGTAQGLLQLHFARERSFTPEQIAWGNRFATRAAAALATSLAHQRRRQTFRAITNLHAVSQLLVSRKQVAIRELLHQIGTNARTLLKADLVTLYEYEQSTETFIHLPPVIVGPLWQAQPMHGEVGPEDVPARIIRRVGDNYYAVDAVNDPLMRSPERSRGVRDRFIVREGIRSAAAIPLKAGAEIVGIMFVNYRRVHDFRDEDERRLINIFASAAAIAVHNWRFFAAKDDELHRKVAEWRERSDELAQLWHACTAITSSTNVAGVLKRVVESSRAMLGAKVSLIFPYRQASDSFILDWVTWDPPGVIADARPESPRVDGITQAVIRSDEGFVVVGDCGDPPPHLDLGTAAAFFRDQRIGSFIGVRLAVPRQASLRGAPGGTETVGVLYVDFEEPRTFTAREITLARMFADFAAMAIWNASEHAHQMAKRLKVFLSYSHLDVEKVGMLRKRLDDDGYAPWFDQKELVPGDTWPMKVQEALRNSDVFIACLSEESISKDGYVHAETQLALEVAKEKPPGTIFIIPAKLEPCPLPSPFKDIQSVDLFDHPRGYERLKLALQVRADGLTQP